MAILKNAMVRAVSVGCACSLLVTGAWLLGGLEGLETLTLDARFHALPRPKPSKDVALIAVDDGSISWFEKNKQARWPIPRGFYGQLVGYLVEDGARSIVFDMIFDKKDLDRTDFDPGQTDLDFADALKAKSPKQGLKPVVLGIRSIGRSSRKAVGEDSDEAPLEGRDSSELESRFRVLAPPALGEQTPPWALVPISQLLENTDRLGATVFTEDSDGVCRRTPLVAGAGDVTFPSLALAAVLQYEKTSYIQSVGSRYRVGSKTFETVGGRLVLNWYGRGNQGGAFPYYPLSFVFRGIDIKEGAKPEPGELALKGGEFKDKIVFIGGTATALMDLKPTPFTHLAPYPGMEIHATAASNLLNGDYLRRIPLWVTALLVFFLGIAASVFFFRAKSAVTGALAPIALGVIYLGVAAFVFVRAYLWMDLAAPLSSILLSLIAAAVVSYASEGRARREIRRTFSSLVSPQIVNALMEDPSRWEFGGNEVEATVLFSDVKNFTTLSESCAPKELVTYLNDYFTKATHGILARDGAIDKYIGDAIMAEFGAVVPDPDHAKNACAAALELQRQDFKYGHDRPGGALDFITRVGINTGRMVVGLVGGHHRNFTAIGDSVNLASRLEGANKVYGTRIMVSESTANLVKDSFVIRELDYLTVKGKTKPIRIFELVGEKGQVPADRMAYVDAFHAALKLYHGRSFAEAKAAFQKLTSPEDPQLAAEEYIHRCETFIATPPPADWDGVYQLKSK